MNVIAMEKHTVELKRKIMTGPGRVARAGSFVRANVRKAEGGWFAMSPARVQIKHGGETIRWVEAITGRAIDQSSAPIPCPGGLNLEIFGKAEAIAAGSFEIEVLYLGDE